MTKRLFLAVVLALILPKVTLAHGGGLDGSGCHYDRRTGDYHCHRGATAAPSQPAPASSASEPTAIAPIQGVATVIDGDTLEVHGQRIRLHGVDAPESSQTCADAAGKPYRCGQQAALALADLIGRRPVTCGAKDTDRYGRTVAVCTVAGQSVNAWLVEQGYAVAYQRYSKDYLAAEVKARAGKIGIWQGAFDMPWDWRAAHKGHR